MLSGLGASAVAASAIAGFFWVSPVDATEPVTPEQLKLFEDQFMQWVVKGDLLFHGDPATEEEFGVKLSETGMACAMCHPMGSDTHPQSFPKFQVSMAEFATLRDMTNWCIEKPMQGTVIDVDSDAMKALEAYMTWSNEGSELQAGKY
jgi:thiosulfate dehydrogenase